MAVFVTLTLHTGLGKEMCCVHLNKLALYWVLKTLAPGTMDIL
jgi:hypothetical protein